MPLMRVVGLLVLSSLVGCASSPVECVGIADDWLLVDESDVPAAQRRESFSSKGPFSTEDDSVILWYRSPDSSLFACHPGWNDEGCGQKTYKVMKVDSEWKAVPFNGVICTG